MADDLLGFLTSAEQIAANHAKYADMYSDKGSNLVNSETFLNLLVAEMTNQDPLEPTTNTEFITQMATFSQMQYMQDMSNYSMGTYASSIVGKTVTAYKMGNDGNYVNITGVVDSVIKNENKYYAVINGIQFELDKITSIAGTADKTDAAEEKPTDNSELGNAIANASLMVGMYATVSTDIDGKHFVDAGFIERIEIKDGVIRAVINNTAFDLSDIVEVAYGYVADNGDKNEENTEAAEEAADETVEDTQAAGTGE